MRDITKFILADDLEVPKLMNVSWDITDNYNYWYKKGTNNILLVAHIDTLPRINNKKRFKEKSKSLELINFNGIIQARDSILGADDRAGCYAINQLYHKYGTQCSILLTNFEETGGIGVNTFISDHPDLLTEYKLFIELDRMGIDQFTHYNNFLDDELEFLLMGFNFTYNIGSYSDIMDLSEHYKIQSVNLSVGYYNQHSKSEYLDFNSLEYLLIPRYNNLISTLEDINESYYIPEIQKITQDLNELYWKYVENLTDEQFNTGEYLEYHEWEQEYYDFNDLDYDPCYVEYRDYLDYSFQNV